MFKKIITLITMNLIFAFAAFSVEVEDSIRFISREIRTDGSIHKSFFKYVIDEYDKVTNKFSKILYFNEEGHAGYAYQYWYSPSEFPTKVEIDELLKNCENLGWKKEIVKVKTGTEGEVKDFEVCRTTKALYATFPVNADIFYYGHFPIYGVAKAEYLDGSSFYSDNLLMDF